MNASAPVQKRSQRPQVLLNRLTIAVLLGCSGAAQAQLVDGGFDTLSLTTLAAVIGGPTFLYGQWGQESSTRSTGVGINIPNTPNFMLSMTNNGGLTTQTGQAIDVSGAPFAAQIATGTATFSYSALFNADAGFPTGGLAMSFFSGNSFATAIGVPVLGNITVDNIPGNNWQPLTITGSIPVGTASLLAQVFYVEASLALANGALQPGFVDSARLTISAVPEPSTWALMGLGGLLVGWRHRRLMRQEGSLLFRVERDSPI